jgi:ADP-ribosylglycohydrolase
LLGAIAGDIIGSIYEHSPIKTRDFPLFDPHCRFTDDSVLTIAVARSILDGTGYLEGLREFGRRYPDAGYGGTFRRWLLADDPRPYQSWGNGSAMRVSPVGFAFDTPAKVLEEARRSAVVTHDHPEGIKGAQATALAVFLARTGHEREDIRRQIGESFGYDLGRRLDAIRPGYGFDVSCQGTVPEAIIAFLESDSYENAVRNAISLGGDSDTLACIAGGIAEAFYGGIPAGIRDRALALLPDDLRNIAETFSARFPPAA